MNKRGEVLVENVIFMVLNLVFLVILTIFLLKQGAGSVLLEENYAKQIALIIDSARPDMIIEINMKKALTVAEDKGIDFKNAVSINQGYVLVKLSPDSGVEYHTFNNITVNAYPVQEINQYTGVYVLTFSR